MGEGLASLAWLVTKGGLPPTAALRNLIGILNSAPSLEKSLVAALAWVKAASLTCNFQGISACHFLSKGWDLPYPETTGYFIPTLLAASRSVDDHELRNLAKSHGEWESKIQTSGGGVLSRPDRAITRVFNTGQAIFGWLALYKEFNDDRFLNSATRAADYLSNLQESDGSWIQDTHCGARTYHSRVAWALLELHQVTKRDRDFEAALKNLTWVKTQQTESGWFQNCGFNDDIPITHVLEYTLKGLFESALLLSDGSLKAEVLQRVNRALDKLLDSAERCPTHRIPGMLSCAYDESWSPQSQSSCLTGNAQFSALFLRAGLIQKRSSYLDFGALLLDVLQRTQFFSPKCSAVHGAIAGSFPIWGAYHAWSIPNWGMKFFIDALLYRINTSDTHKIMG